MSSNSGKIGLFSLELLALECQKNGHYISDIRVYPIFIKLVDRYKIFIILETGPHCTIYFGVTCPWLLACCADRLLPVGRLLFNFARLLPSMSSCARTKRILVHWQMWLLSAILDFSYSISSENNGFDWKLAISFVSMSHCASTKRNSGLSINFAVWFPARTKWNFPLATLLSPPLDLPAIITSVSV